MPHIPAGKYRATAIGSALGVSKNKQTPYISVSFRFLDQPTYPEMRWDGYFSEKAQERTIESLRACGWKGDDVSECRFPPGNEVIVTVEDDSYEKDGEVKTHSKIQWVNDIKGPSINSMDTASAKAFAAKIRGAFIAFDQKHKVGPSDNTDTTEAIPF